MRSFFRTIYNVLVIWAVLFTLYCVATMLSLLAS